MTLSEPDVRKKLAKGITRPGARTAGETIYGVFTIAADGDGMAGKYFDSSEREAAVEYYDKHQDPSNEFYGYEPAAEFLVFFTAMVEAVSMPGKHATPDTEVWMKLTDIEFHEYHSPDGTTTTE